MPLFSILFAFLSLSRALDLEAAVEKARSMTETLAQKWSLETQARESVDQAWGSLLPTLSFNVGRTTQDNSGNPLLGNYTQYGRFTVSQNLFAGTTEYFGMSAAKANVRVQEQKRLQSELTLVSEVASAYFGVLQAEQSVQNVQSSIDVVARRIQELRQRARIGRSRTGEVLSAQVQLSGLEAQLEASKNSLTTARETFARATGLPADTEIAKNLTRYLPPKTLPDLATWERGLGSRPDRRAAAETVGYSEALLSVAKGGHLPTLTLAGNYYVNRENALFAGGSFWDITLTLSVPLFAGGITQSKVRAAAETWKQALYTQASLERESVTSLRSAYTAVTSGKKRLVLLEEALSNAEANFREQTRDYGHGLVTNLEVLSASQALLDARQQRDQALTTLCKDWVTLRISAGQNPIEGRTEG